MSPSLRVALLHPDFAIGGAARLMLDAALALQDMGHEVHVFTAHYNTLQCYPETIVNLPLTVVGGWLPRNLFGRFLSAPCAYLRMILVALYLVLFSGFSPDVVLCDQISACVPFLRLLSSARVVFYCHWPDRLFARRDTMLRFLATLMRSLYRMPLDWLELKTTAMADKVLVNSKFTAEIFKDTFPNIKINPQVLYPSVNTRQYDSFSCSKRPREKFTFLSVNRFVRPKNLQLAIRSFARLKSQCSQDLQLIMAGGFDPRSMAYTDHFPELQSLAKDLGLSEGRDIFFLKSPCDTQRLELLQTCHALLYTPSGEHFGIVPIEAMYCGLPVVAVDDGGPKETVVHGETGFLCRSDEDSFVEAMMTLLEGGQEMKERMGRKGKQRVIDSFSFDAFSRQLEAIVCNENE